MDKDVIAWNGVRRVFQAHLFHDATEADLRHLHAVGLERFNDFARDRKTHENSL
jgi:hypothetical protein